MQCHCILYISRLKLHIGREKNVIKRQITDEFLALLTQFPAVGVVGPRQSGKTTLVKSCLPDYAYVTMEDLDKRAMALADPRLFFASYDDAPGLIIDEIQEAPELLNYMQGIIDQAYRPGRFVITGSQNLLVHEKVSQTLAGRIASLTLLPLAVSELKQANLLPNSLEETLVKGFYPRLYDQPIDIETWFANYISNYVERDVRQVINLANLVTFQRFLKLCAGRVGQLLNYTSLANDCGISPNTARAWISILQASYILYLVPPYFKNLNKRVIQTPKLHFYDTGLCCALLEISSSRQLFNHYLRGPIFESFVMSELAKYIANRGKRAQLHFWRDVQGNEVDAMVERADTLLPIEIKSGLTIDNSFFDGLRYWNTLKGHETERGFLVYGGTERPQHATADILGWQDVQTIVDRLFKA